MTQPDDSYWRRRPVGEVIPWAEELLDICATGFPTDVNVDDRVAGMSLGYLARSAALLNSMLVLARADDHEAIPIVYRTLLETWLMAVYLVHGGDEALSALDKQVTYESKRVADALSLPEPEGESAPLPLWKVAKAVRDDLGDEFPTRAYNHHFRVVALHWSHGHLGSLTAFFSESDGSVSISPARGEPEAGHAAALMFAMGVSLVAGLCNLLSAMPFGTVDGQVLDEFLVRWRAL